MTVPRYNAAPGVLTFDIAPLKRDGDPDIPTDLLRAFDLVEALSALGEPLGADGSSAGAAIRRELIGALERAAGSTSDALLAEHLAMRSDAVRSGSFDDAATFGATNTLPLELLLSPTPSWANPSLATGVSATLGRRHHDDDLRDIGVVDAAVQTDAVSCLTRHGVFGVEASFQPPIYSICDLVRVAGEAAVPPYHFANFLPEDEGQPGKTAKTVVYRNLYLLRFHRVTWPLISSLDGDVEPIPESDASTTLLHWLRAHDVGHSYFDSLCLEAGLSAHVLHATREVLADCIAHSVVLRASQPQAAAVIVGECLRYARRDPEQFADALAARAQLSWLTRHLGDPRLYAARSLADAAADLVGETVARLVRGDAAAFERWLLRLAANAPLPSWPVGTVHDVLALFGPRPIDQVRVRPGARFGSCAHRLERA